MVYVPIVSANKAESCSDKKYDDCWYEPRHDKTNKMTVHPAKTQISLGIRPVWSESSLSAWRKLGSLAIHLVHSKDSDQMSRPVHLQWPVWPTVMILQFSYSYWSRQTV